MKESLAMIGALMGVAIAVAAFIVSLRQHRVAEQQLFMMIVEHVHQRYASLYKDLQSLPENISRYGDLTPKHRCVIGAYINLCAEQFHWHRRRGLIDPDVWTVWDAGISEKVKLPVVRQAWQELHCGEVYYEGFKEYVDQKLQMSVAPL